MNMRFYAIFTAILLALGVSAFITLGVPFLTDSNITATVHGSTYAWDTLEPLNDTVININSNPPQSIVAKNGMYSFELSPGDYIITARYYQNNTLTYSKETTFKIEDKGSYVFDLLLYQVSKNPVMGTTVAKIDNLNSVNPTEQTKNEFSTRSYFPIALALFLFLGGGYKLSRKHKKMKNNRFQERKSSISEFLVKVLSKSIGPGGRSESGNIGEAVSITEPIIDPVKNSEIETAALNKLPLSTDLREILNVIQGYKGRITQKDLRSRLEYSEVKVSLLLSELEKRGLIKKFKNGRENIVILIDEKH